MIELKDFKQRYKKDYMQTKQDGLEYVIDKKLKLVVSMQEDKVMVSDGDLQRYKTSQGWQWLSSKDVETILINLKEKYEKGGYQVQVELDRQSDSPHRSLRFNILNLTETIERIMKKEGLS